MGPGLVTAGPPGWGARGTAVDCGVDGPDVPRPTVTLVCSEVWVLLFTVLPPVRWDVVWVERADGCAPVPAVPDCPALGCLGGVVLDVVPAGPGRTLVVCAETVERLCAPAVPSWAAGPLPVAPVPVGPDRGAFGCFGAVFLVGVPAVPGRGMEASNAPPFGVLVPAVLGRELLGCLGADAPGCPCGVVLAFDVPGV